MKHALLTAMLAAAVSPAAYAQNLDDEPESQRSSQLQSEILRLDVEARADWQLNSRDGHTDKGDSGFEGKYLIIRADGQIIDGLTYSWRQRLNKKHGDSNFFDATDWVYLNYKTGGWNFQAGKQVVAIGGYEYDRSPVDLYGCSVFWNNIPCYDFGVAVGYDITGNDRLTAQVTQSPFFSTDNRDMYAYNLMWNGRHGFYESIWSANLIEYADGKYINYIALGNKFSYGKAWLELDFMNRASSHQTFLFKDCSVMAELSWHPGSKWRVFGKYTYDVNHSGTAADLTVLSGTELNMVGAGAEFYPLALRRHRLRIHAGLFYSWGSNANESNPMQNKTLFVSAGLTWDMNLLNINRR